MSLRERWRRFASRAELEAALERAEVEPGALPVADASDRQRATVSGVLRSVTIRPRERVPAVQAELFDGSGVLDLVWLGRREIPGIEPGRRLRAEGRVCDVHGRATIYNPRYRLRVRPGE